MGERHPGGLRKIVMAVVSKALWAKVVSVLVFGRNYSCSGVCRVCLLRFGLIVLAQMASSYNVVVCRWLQHVSNLCVKRQQ